VREPVLAFVALGANLGDAQGTLRSCMGELDKLPGTRLTAFSALYRSAPVDAKGPDFINAVVALETTLCAPELLQQLQKMELSAGRERPYLHAPRTLDLDLLLYGEGQISSEHLTVPHPRMNQRAFVLLPLADIAPQRVSAGDLQALQGQRIERLAEPA
jgi:2-amino-4-hydroxy-6-hydroxymethyldihydropteridine diphosphokinase